MYIYIYTQVGPNLAAKNHSISLNLSGSSDFPPKCLALRLFFHVRSWRFHFCQIASSYMFMSFLPNLPSLCLHDFFAASRRGCSLWVCIGIGPCFSDEGDGLSKLCHSSRNSYFINQETREDLILRCHHGTPADQDPGLNMTQLMQQLTWIALSRSMVLFTCLESLAGNTQVQQFLPGNRPATLSKSGPRLSERPCPCQQLP